LGLRDFRKYWKFLLEPFSVFEEICGVILVEIVPPFGGVGVESILRRVSLMLGEWLSRICEEEVLFR